MGNSIYESAFSPFSYLCVQGRIQSRVYISVPKRDERSIFSPFFVFDIKARALLLVITLSFTVSGAQSGSNAQTLYCTRAWHRGRACVCACVWAGHIKLPFWRRSVSYWNRWINGWDLACGGERWRDMRRWRERGMRWMEGEILEWHEMGNVIGNG